MQKPSEPSAAGSLVIVVDDDPAVRNSLKFSLEIEGFAVRTYACGMDLLDSGEAREGQCFVIDQKMPGLTGMDLIAKLRARDIVAPAILITSQPAALLLRRAAQANVLIVEKPLLSSTLLDQIRQACVQNQRVQH